jgi:hypothetical protein
MDMYDTKAYAFNTKTGTWITQAFNSSANPSLTKSNGNFAFVDSYSIKAYVFNSKTGTWISQKQHSIHLQSKFNPCQIKQFKKGTLNNFYANIFIKQS